MALTALQLVTRVKNRTHFPHETQIVGELASAADWVSNKVFKSGNGPDLLSSFGTELTIATRTSTYDLGANLTGTMYGVKQLWLKLSSDSSFQPMIPADTSERRFQFEDQWAASDTTTVATSHPVMYDIVNFAQVRFAPPLPAGAIIRVDFWLRPEMPDQATNNDLTYGNDVLEPTLEAIMDKATAQVYMNMDEHDRADYWDRQARDKINDAVYVLDRRHQGPTVTKPFRGGTRRWI